MSDAKKLAQRLTRKQAFYYSCPMGYDVFDTSNGPGEVRPAPVEAFDEFLSDHLQDLILDSADVQEFLSAFAGYSARVFSAQDSEVICGVTLLRDRKPASAAFSDGRARLLDEIQNNFGDGPCLQAAREQVTVHVRDLDSETRWPEYAALLRANGVTSVAAVPFNLEADGRAALNLYSTRRDGLDRQTVAAAEDYARRAAKSLRLAVRFSVRDDNAADLLAALESRTVIDLAVGIVMGQNRCSQHEAFTILRTASGRTNMKLRNLATQIVASVGERAPETHFDT